MLPCTAAKGKVSSTLAERADAPETDQGRTWRDDEPQCLTQPPHRAHAAQADRAHGTERRSERSMGIFSHTREFHSNLWVWGEGEGVGPVAVPVGPGRSEPDIESRRKILLLSTEATPSLVILTRALPARVWGVKTPTCRNQKSASTSSESLVPTRLDSSSRRDAPFRRDDRVAAALRRRRSCRGRAALRGLRRCATSSAR